MQDQKIVDLNKYRKSQKNIIKNVKLSKKMLFIIIAASLVVGCVLWHFLVENPMRLDVAIPASNNITYNHDQPIAMNVLDLENQFHQYEGKPILFFIYTTWCSSCIKQFPVINDIAREFQNTDLQVVTLAVDRDIDGDLLQKHIDGFGDVYFQPQYLHFKEGFRDFLKRKNIPYNGRIPYTVLISQYGEVVEKFVGYRTPNYLRNKIIREIF